MKKISFFAMVCVLGVTCGASYGATSLVSGGNGSTGAMVARAGSLRTNKNQSTNVSENKSSVGTSETRVSRITPKISGNISSGAAPVVPASNVAAVSELNVSISNLEKNLANLKDQISAILATSHEALNTSQDASNTANEAFDTASSAKQVAANAEEKVTEAVVKQINDAQAAAAKAQQAADDALVQLKKTEADFVKRVDAKFAEADKKYASVESVANLGADFTKDINERLNKVNVTIDALDNSLKDVSEKQIADLRNKISDNAKEIEENRKVIYDNQKEISGVSQRIEDVNTGIISNDNLINERFKEIGNNINIQKEDFDKRIISLQEEQKNELSKADERAKGYAEDVKVYADVQAEAQANKARDDAYKAVDDAKEYAAVKAEEKAREAYDAAKEHVVKKINEKTAYIDEAVSGINLKYEEVTKGMIDTVGNVDAKLLEYRLQTLNSVDSRINEQVNNKIDNAGFVTMNQLDTATGNLDAKFRAELQPVKMNINTIQADINGLPTVAYVTDSIKNADFVTPSALNAAVTNKIADMDIVTSDNIASKLPETVMRTDDVPSYLATKDYVDGAATKAKEDAVTAAQSYTDTQVAGIPNSLLNNTTFMNEFQGKEATVEP